MAFIVHRAFYELMKRHPDRAVNQIIYPHMVRYFLLHMIFEYICLFFILNIMMNILGCPFLMHNAFFIVLLAGLLGLSPKRDSRRNWLSHNELLEEYGNFYNSTSIFFHGYFSLYLPFTWGFIIKVQSESYGELTADNSIKIVD